VSGTVLTMSTRTRAKAEPVEQYLAVFSALSEPLRVRILHILLHDKGNDVPCTRLDDELPVGKSTVSYHVGILRRAGMISLRKEGRNYFYQVREETLEKYAPNFLEYLKEADAAQLAA
jgi:DNA-binding transcriptional ArsR family regulator